MTAEPTPIHAPTTTAEKLAELRERLELAKEPGGEKAAAKRDKKGIPSARARIHAAEGSGGARTRPLSLALALAPAGSRPRTQGAAY